MSGMVPAAIEPVPWPQCRRVSTSGNPADCSLTDKLRRILAGAAP